MIQQLYFIRHGETAWSLTGQHTGRTDLPLIAAGEEGGRNLAGRLGAVSFTRVFTSPRQRARQTAALAGFGAVVEIEPDLAEWDYGDFEGLRRAEILLRQPDWNIYRDGCPHGESPAAITARVDGLIHRLRGLDGNIAVFSHGHLGRVLAARWIGLPIAEAQRFVLGTASVSVLGFEHEAPVIVHWNT